MEKENTNYKPLEYQEIVFSGSFAKKIYYSYLKQIRKSFNCNINYNKKELTFDGDPNALEQIAFNIMTITNDYLKNIINKVLNEEFREKIIQFSHNEYTRKSLFHIFNIELLCFSANKKPEKFQIIMNCVTDPFILTHDIENYPFYLFAILDAENLETAKDIYNNLREQENIISNIYSYVEEKLSAKEIKLVQENINKLQII